MKYFMYLQVGTMGTEVSHRKDEGCRCMKEYVETKKLRCSPDCVVWI